MNNQIIILILCSFSGIALCWFLLVLFDSVRVRYLRKKYIEYNDLSKQGELRRNKGASEFGRVSEVTDRELLSEFERGKFFPTTTTEQVRSSEPVVRQDNTNPRGKFFGFLNRKK